MVENIKEFLLTLLDAFLSLFKKKDPGECKLCGKPMEVTAEIGKNNPSKTTYVERAQCTNKECRAVTEVEVAKTAHLS